MNFPTENKRYDLVNAKQIMALESETSSACLKFFNIIGSLNFDYRNITKYFINAYVEDKNLALKILFYARDKRGALETKNTFRCCLNIIGNLEPNVGAKLIDDVIKFGRIDDLFSFTKTPVESKMIKQLSKSNYLLLGSNDMPTTLLGEVTDADQDIIKSVRLARKENRFIIKNTDEYLNISNVCQNKLLNNRFEDELSNIIISIAKSLEKGELPTIDSNLRKYMGKGENLSCKVLSNAQSNSFSIALYIFLSLYFNSSYDIDKKEFVLKDELMNMLETTPFKYVLIIGENESTIPTYIYSDEKLDAANIVKDLKKQYSKRGFSFPTIMYWNSVASSIHGPMQTNIEDLKLVNGFNGELLQTLIQNLKQNDLDYMNTCLQKYTKIGGKN